MIIQMSRPTSINICDQEITNGLTAVYKSHVEIKEDPEVFFRFNKKMYTQSPDGNIYESYFGIHKDVEIVFVYLSKQKRMVVMKNVDDYIYGQKVQLKLRKQHLKFLEPQGYETGKQAMTAPRQT